MRRLLYVALALGLLVLAAFAAAVAFIDTRAIAEAAASGAGDALGEPVALGEIDLMLFPLPAARVRDIVIGEGETPLARVGEVRVRISLLPLLVGRVVLRALEVEALALRTEGLALDGDLVVTGELGGPWQVDLSQTELRAGESLRKPRGARLLLAGEHASLDAGPTGVPFVISLGPSELTGHLVLEGERRLRLHPSVLELGPIRDWFVSEPPLAGGRIVFEELDVVLAPLDVRGALSLDAVEITLPNGTATITGPVRGEGPVVVGSPLDLRIGGQASTLDLGYRLENGSLDLRTELAGAALEPLVSALLGSSPLTGTLAARVHVTGPPEPAALRGKGTIEITQGQVRGFSLMKSVLGELSALPIAAAALRGDDLSRYDEREFKRLAASFRLADGIAHIDDLVVEYRHSTVELHGTVALADGALALSGRLLLDDEREKVIPIEGVRGTVSSPRVVLDRTAVSSAFATYATGGRTREKLDEQLGPGGADLVEDLLEKFLRGSGKK